MSKNILWGIIIILLAIMIAFGIKFVFLGSTAKVEDGRTQVLLSVGERDLVLAEMRQLLVSTQQVMEGLSESNMKKVEVAAREVGMQATSTMDVTLKAKLPMAFKQLGFSTHKAFDMIADMARSKASPQDIQSKLAETMNQCVACHSSFQLPILK